MLSTSLLSSSSLLLCHHQNCHHCHLRHCHRHHHLTLPCIDMITNTPDRMIVYINTTFIMTSLIISKHTYYTRTVYTINCINQTFERSFSFCSRYRLHDSQKIYAKKLQHKCQLIGKRFIPTRLTKTVSIVAFE